MDTNKAQKTISDIFNLLGYPAETVSYSLDEKRGHIFSVTSVAFEKLSVEREDVVKDLVYVIKKILSRGAVSDEESFKCTVDINNLQSKTDDRIRLKAKNAAEEAKNLKTDVLMEPMSSYERMIVHSTLAGLPDISTESVGEGKERRLKVKYLAI